jgi:hypothetical protein
MAWTQADIDTLKAAIASGSVLQAITFGEQTFTFRTIDEMLKVLAVMQGEVSTATGTGRSRLAATSKGV